ncbi:hypothetical protein [Halospeciosus flavus]|uniref:Uncharacterized protein n=1 Tax=Halospeciosus flavus TaxID=3032283 RepID=A0ABD5Z099_9EURY|nr:hypothetical protein [Halospeciosus flavus]
MTEIRTIEARLDREAAVDRTATTSMWRYAWRQLQSWFGNGPEPERVQRLYYPNYIAYTTVTIPRRFAGDRVEKFLGGVDGMTARSGAIDVDLPERERHRVDDESVLEPDVDDDRVYDEWRDWVFEYVNRKFRPLSKPEFDLDDVELVYTPYWVVEFEDSTYAVNGLTKAADPIRTNQPIDEQYRRIR